jgi:1,3-propanediol dehydrogenase/alcohol dehydrogenase
MFTQINNFNYLMPSKILFGNNSLMDIGNESVGLGKRALLVTGKNSARKYGYTLRVVESLKEKNIETKVFEEIESNPSAKTINKGGELAKREGCDFIIGLGGGSALDAAKGIAAAVSENKSVWDFVEGTKIGKEILPIVAIPTTAGTGSEATPYAVISNKDIKRKDAFVSQYIFPKLTILDPLLTVSLSPYYTASSGIDTLSHAIEAYTSVFANPISELFAIKAIELVAKNLRTAFSNGLDIVARSNMLLASTLAGVAIAQADTTIAHVIGEAVGAVYDTDHGTSVALTLPAVMEFNCISSFEKYANISRLMGENISDISVRDAAYRSVNAVRNLIKDIKLPSNLKGIGVKDTKDIMALVLRPGLTSSNPRNVEREDFEEIIDKSCNF